MADSFADIRADIIADPANSDLGQLGFMPVYTASENARIMIVGQAPGRKAQHSNVPWNDMSGDTLRKWMGVDRETFYNPDIFALVPMDFYYPGKGNHGDNPPRKGFAEQWHPRLLKLMPNVDLIILVGLYAQKYYLGKKAGKNLTETVFSYHDYLPDYFPLVHPSPLNFRWRAVNPWFEKEIVPALYERVQRIINTGAQSGT
ncbi:MAG TPA: uracil-DNA glycosylase family protein [Dongiaceae bacterium]|nr:uracil-DNA glycosylase family protein [Dongiaceae bacterium]